MKNSKKKVGNNNESTWMGAGVAAAVVASLCCITPVLAIVAGTTGLAATFSFLEPVRPFLIGITIAILVFAWYQKFKREGDLACECETGKPSFFRSKSFLGIITVLAIAMLAFPTYSDALLPESKKNTTAEFVTTADTDVAEVRFTVLGMTCEACAGGVKWLIDETGGVIESKISYKTGEAIVRYDKSRASFDDIKKSINESGFRVKEE